MAIKGRKSKQNLIQVNLIKVQITLDVADRRMEMNCGGGRDCIASKPASSVPLAGWLNLKSEMTN